MQEFSVNTRRSWRLLWSPWLVAATVFACYCAWLVTHVDPSHPAEIALIGERFLDAGQGHSNSIDALRDEAVDRWGYDGQFVLYIALAPVDAEAYIDYPAYRYTRIFYPLLARAVVLGTPGAIPWALAVINVLAATLLALAVALYLRRLGVSPWYALIVGLTPGLYFSVSRDLTEPLAYALVAAGLLLLTTRAAYSQLLAGALMGLAALTRESAVIFALAAVVCIAIGRDELGRRVERNPRGALLFGALSIAPVVILKGILTLTLSGESTPRAALLETVPFAGLMSRPEFGNLEKQQLVAVVVPALLAVTIALVVRRVATPLLALYLNVVLLVVLLPKAAYEHVLTSSRITLGVPVAFVMCLPLVPARGRVLLATIPTFFWMLGWLSHGV